MNSIDAGLISGATVGKPQTHVSTHSQKQVMPDDSKSMFHFKQTVGLHNFSPTLVNRKGMHLTHWACDEIIQKYGSRSFGCCCTGHKCKGRN